MALVAVRLNLRTIQNQRTRKWAVEDMDLGFLLVIGYLRLGLELFPFLFRGKDL